MIIRKVPGAMKWGDISLDRRIDTSLSLWEWRKQVIDGDVDAARRHGFDRWPTTRRTPEVAPLELRVGLAVEVEGCGLRRIGQRGRHRERHDHPRGSGASLMGLQTEFAFTLPKGFVDDEGSLHRSGTMRLACARDEIEPLRDARVKENDAYATVIVLSRVVTELGHVNRITPKTIENLFVSDFTYLQDFYRVINFGDPSILEDPGGR